MHVCDFQHIPCFVFSELHGLCPLTNHIMCVEFDLHPPFKSKILSTFLYFTSSPVPNDRSSFAIKTVCFKAVLHQWRRLQLELWCLDVEKQGHNIGCFKIWSSRNPIQIPNIWLCGNGNPPCFLSEIRLEMVDKRLSIHPCWTRECGWLKIEGLKGSQGKRVSIETQLQLFSGLAQASHVQLLVTIKRRRMWLDRNTEFGGVELKGWCVVMSKWGKTLMFYTHSNENKGLQEKRLLRFQEMAGASGKAIFLRKCNGKFCFWEQLRKGLIACDRSLEFAVKWKESINIESSYGEYCTCIWEVVGFHYRTLVRSCPHFPFTYCVWFVETVSYQVEKYIVHLWVYTNSFPCFS